MARHDPPSAGWHTLGHAEVVARLETSVAGLSSAEAARRLAEAGPNELRASHGPSPWRLLAASSPTC